MRWVFFFLTSYLSDFVAEQQSNISSFPKSHCLRTLYRLTRHVFHSNYCILMETVLHLSFIFVWDLGFECTQDA